VVEHLPSKLEALSTKSNTTTNVVKYSIWQNQGCFLSKNIKLKQLHMARLRVV
jgi:hypothetical protein